MGKYRAKENCLYALFISLNINLILVGIILYMLGVLVNIILSILGLVFLGIIVIDIVLDKVAERKEENIKYTEEKYFLA